MVIQAGLARLSMLDDPSTAQVAFRKIVTSGREALRASRLIVPLARDDGDKGAAASLSRLVELTEAMSAAGLTTELVVVGAPSLERRRRASVYRVVQEALTNALKHSGGGPPLTLHVGDDSTDVRIVNRASGHAVPIVLVGAGHGLVGIAERVCDHGGTLQARECFDGAFEV